jgi:hypothetical protein
MESPVANRERRLRLERSHRRCSCRSRAPGHRERQRAALGCDHSAARTRLPGWRCQSRPPCRQRATRPRSQCRPSSLRCRCCKGRRSDCVSPRGRLSRGADKSHSLPFSSLRKHLPLRTIRMPSPSQVWGSFKSDQCQRHSYRRPTGVRDGPCARGKAGEGQVSLRCVRRERRPTTVGACREAAPS